MTTRIQAEAAGAKAFSEARRAFHLLPTSVAVVRMANGWGLRIGLPREPVSVTKLENIDGVPVEVSVVGSASLLG